MRAMSILVLDVTVCACIIVLVVVKHVYLYMFLERTLNSGDPCVPGKNSCGNHLSCTKCVERSNKAICLSGNHKMQSTILIHLQKLISLNL